jgi:hypothetical protein
MFCTATFLPRACQVILRTLVASTVRQQQRDRDQNPFALLQWGMGNIPCSKHHQVRSRMMLEQLLVQ